MIGASLAEGRGGAGQQEHAHRLGAAGQGPRVRSELRVDQARQGGADTGRDAGLKPRYHKQAFFPRRRALSGPAPFRVKQGRL